MKNKKSVITKPAQDAAQETSTVTSNVVAQVKTKMKKQKATTTTTTTSTVTSNAEKRFVIFIAALAFFKSKRRKKKARSHDERPYAAHSNAQDIAQRLLVRNKLRSANVARVSANSVLLGGRLVHFPKGELAHNVFAMLAKHAPEIEETLLVAKPKPKPSEELSAASRLFRNMKAGAKALLVEIPTDAKAHPVDSMAWSIARQIGKFHMNGNSKLSVKVEVPGRLTSNKGEKITKAQAKATGARVAAQVTNGTGVPLSEHDMEELYLSARASLIAQVTQGVTLSAAWKEASSNARRMLYVIRREPLYDSAEKAARAHDRAYRTFASSFDVEGGGTGQAQPTCGEFLATSNAESYFEPRKIALLGYRRAKRALRAYYRGKPKYNRMMADLLRDLKSCREHARSIMAGNVTWQKYRDDATAARQKADLGDRVEKGHELLLVKAAYEQAASAPKAKQVTREKRRIMELPQGHAENWLYDIEHNLLPAASRVLAWNALLEKPRNDSWTPRKGSLRCNLASRPQLEELAMHFSK